MDFIGQRADKVVIRDLMEGEDTESVDTIVKNGVEREVVSYTSTCPESDCDGEGYYDDIGEIICDECGCVISGGRKPVVPLEYNTNANDSMGSSRGLEKMPGTRGSRGSHQPSI